MENTPPHRIVLTTASSPDEARKIARALVEERLAACVNIVNGVGSIYRWKGAIEESEEILLLIKTREDKLPQLEKAVRRLHSYDLPEFLVLRVEHGGTAYLQWLDETLQ